MKLSHELFGNQNRVKMNTGDYLSNFFANIVQNLNIVWPQLQCK